MTQNNNIFNSFRLLMHALITRLSVFGTYAVRMNIGEEHRVYPNMRGVYCVVTGVYTTEAEIEVVVFN